MGAMIGSFVSAFVAYSMVVGDIQKIVKFRGISEEIFFTFIVIAIGMIFLTIAISSLISKD